MSDHDDHKQLEACREAVERLEEENEHLREAAGAFGQLAERLNQILQDERRTGAERRHDSRFTDDRRTPGQA